MTLILRESFSNPVSSEKLLQYLNILDTRWLEKGSKLHISCPRTKISCDDRNYLDSRASRLPVQKGTQENQLILMHAVKSLFMTAECNISSQNCLADEAEHYFCPQIYRTNFPT